MMRSGASSRHRPHGYAIHCDPLDLPEPSPIPGVVLGRADLGDDHDDENLPAAPDYGAHGRAYEFPYVHSALPRSSSPGDEGEGAARPPEELEL